MPDKKLERFPKEFKNGYLEDIHDRWISPETRELWIHSIDISASEEYEGSDVGIEYMMANKIAKNLHYLLHRSRDLPITIYLDSAGGDWFQGIRIYDTIKAMPYSVKMITCTEASSMGSIILQSADERLMFPNATFLFHKGSVSASGDSQKVYSNIELYKKFDKVMLDIYVEKCYGSKKFKKQSKKTVRECLSKKMQEKTDVFLTAKEAVYWGFADGILRKF